MTPDKLEELYAAIGRDIWFAVCSDHGCPVGTQLVTFEAAEKWAKALMLGVLEEADERWRDLHNEMHSVSDAGSCSRHQTPMGAMRKRILALAAMPHDPS